MKIVEVLKEEQKIINSQKVNEDIELMGKSIIKS